MKLILILVLATLSLAKAKTNVAVRVVVSHQGQCSEDDIAVVEAGVMSVVEQEPQRRNLRERRLDPWYCATVCRNFPKGTCFLAYPLCKSYRREMQGVAAKTPAVDASSVIKTPPAANVQECTNLKSTILSEIELEAEWLVELSSSCKSVLVSSLDLKCFQING
jgi:hypothetical protein